MKLEDLKKNRKALGITQEEASNRLGLNRVSYCNMENRKEIPKMVLSHLDVCSEMFRKVVERKIRVLRHKIAKWEEFSNKL